MIPKTTSPTLSMLASTGRPMETSDSFIGSPHFVMGGTAGGRSTTYYAERLPDEAESSRFHARGATYYCSAMGVKLNARQQAQLAYLQGLTPKFQKIHSTIELMANMQADESVVRGFGRTGRKRVVLGRGG